MPRRIPATRPVLAMALAAALALSGCVKANVSIFGKPGEPYKEQKLDGTGPG